MTATEAIMLLGLLIGLAQAILIPMVGVILARLTSLRTDIAVLQNTRKAMERRQLDHEDRIRVLERPTCRPSVNGQRG